MMRADRSPFVSTKWTCLLAVLACACAGPRVRRLTDFEYMPKAPDAAIDLFIGKLTRPYEPIAIADSERYALQDYEKKTRTEAAQAQNTIQKERMLADLEKRARRLGGDAVQDVRLLRVKIRGVVRDPRVPVPGAWTQGYAYRYFLRGEVVRYVQEVGLPPAKFSHKPEAEARGDEEAKPKKAPLEPELAEEAPPERLPKPGSLEPGDQPPPPERATPETLREPALAEDDEGPPPEVGKPDEVGPRE
ncbi:MAG TPA: hypothetical protein VM492_00305 [Sumerlaeia bacterium]|nr:hypothetical protein [Sumerlaeia bacterium]